MKRISVLTMAILILFVGAFVACGGGGHHGGGGGGGTSTTTALFNFNPTPVFQFAAHRTVTASAPLITTSVSAQAPVSTPIGSYSGFCNTMPVNAEVVLYGIGRWSDSNCSNNFSSFTNDGAPVIQDGTLTALDVYASGTSEGAVVIVYVNSVASAITCTVDAVHECHVSGGTAAVHKGDLLYVTGNAPSGTRAVRAVLTQS